MMGLSGHDLKCWASMHPKQTQLSQGFKINYKPSTTGVIQEEWHGPISGASCGWEGRQLPHLSSPPISKVPPPMIPSSDRGDFWAQPVEILVFATPTGYLFTSSGFPLLNWGIFYKFLQNDWKFSCNLERQPVISQTQPDHL